VYRSVQSSTDFVHSVKPCISGNLSVGSVTLYKSVRHCIGKGWFADATWTVQIGGKDDRMDTRRPIPASSSIHVHRWLLMQPVGIPLSEFQSIHELLSIFIDVLDSTFQ